MAKGAAMMGPNMATMLAVIATDATVSARTMQRALGRAVAQSFNCVTVDGDTSTNDMVLCFATGAAGAFFATGIGIASFLLGNADSGATETIRVSDDRIRKGDLKRLMTRPTMWYLSASMLLVTSLVLFSFSVTFLVDVRKFTNSGATNVLALFVVGFIICAEFYFFEEEVKYTHSYQKKTAHKTDGFFKIKKICYQLRKCVA